MSTTDTRAKLAELFKRLTDPAASDIEALDAFVWFRKMRLDAEDVGQALGTVPNGPPMAIPPSLVTPGGAPAQKDGPLWPFTRRHAGETIAHIARTDPDYLRYMLKQGLKPWLVREVTLAMEKVGQPVPPMPPTTQSAPDDATQAHDTHP